MQYLIKKQNSWQLLNIISLCLLQFILLEASLFIHKAKAVQDITINNLVCTGKFKTSLGQEAPEYCTSAEANSGILIDKEELIGQRQKDNSLKVEIKIFNRGTADGLIEVYNSANKLVDVIIIKGNEAPTGLIQSGSDLFFEYPKTFLSKYPFGDIRRELKEQKITVNIPQGGFINITKSSQTAVLYNTAVLALEISQIRGGDPKFAREESVKKFLLEFAKDTVSSSVKDIFKSEPTAKAIFSLDFIDPNKTAEILQDLWRYSLKKKDNPLLKAFVEVSTTAGNIGIENALDRYVLPGLGSFAGKVREGGNVVNTFTRAADTYNAVHSATKGTITIRDIKAVTNNSKSNNFQNHWAAVYIQRLAAKGILNGFPNNSLNPDAKITRAQFAFIVAKAFNPPAKRQSMIFRDVSSKDWAYQEINKAFAGQFLSAFPDYTFKPEATVSRVNCLVSLVVGLELNSESSNQQLTNYYQDANQIPDFARNSIATATQNKLVVNYPNTRQFNPNQEATIGEVSAFVYQALVYTGKAEPVNSAYVVK